MKRLSQMHLVQYSFWDYETFNLKPGGTAFMGPNGAGKTSLVDAVQIALVGGHGNHIHFNTQSAHNDHRSIRDYALGVTRSGEGDKNASTCKRTEALSYITLVFEGERPEDCVSAGLCIHSLKSEKNHRTMGLYIVPGVRLTLDSHLSAHGAGKAPLEWETFRALIKAEAKKAGRTETVTDKPVAYLAELLHSIAHKGRSIDPSKFLRSLAKSLQLKNIQSVNDFLRDYLVDAQPIDKQGTLKHMKTVQSLIKQIEEVKQQIARLTDIDRSFATVANLYKTSTINAAVRLQLLKESTDAEVASLRASVISLEEDIKRLESDIESLTAKDLVLKQSYEELQRAYNSDPASQNTGQNRRLREALRSTVTSAKQNIQRIVFELRDALATAARLLESIDYHGAGDVAKAAKELDEQAIKAAYPSLLEIKQALSTMGSAATAVSSILKSNNEALVAASDRFTAATEKYKAAQQGIRLPDNDAAKAIALFNQNGIKCRTVASLVKVHDVQWQSAIESFLGINRFALVVDEGRESDAVRLLRSLSQPLYDVTVVQPVHLKSDIGRDVDTQSVAVLLKSDNDIALTYLRRLFGKMRRVQTEDELKEYDRAMTVDGMLSANGGTRRIRLISADSWALGIEVTNAEKDTLRQEVNRAMTEMNEAQRRVDFAKGADDKARRAVKEVSIEKYSLAATELQAADDRMSAASDVNKDALPDYLVSMQTRMREMLTKLGEIATLMNNARDDRGLQKGNLQNTVNKLSAAELTLKKLDVEYTDMTSSIDYDSERALAVYDRALAVATEEGPEAALRNLENETNAAKTKLIREEPTAKSDFIAYINDMSINLIDERSDWRLASIWVKNHVKKLTDSTLAEYESSAQEARLAAKQTFHSDVAFRMREAIKRVEHDIDDLNKILKACPEFTGGERYRFIAPPATAHRGLFDLIQRSALDDSATGSLFEAADETQQTLLKFLEACESGDGKEKNPLEDYRLLFNFDLEIRVGDEVKDYLSKRLGVGSNGEHLVPFYVIAGASLANAYRIKIGESHDGAALMIIDEAFHGFDAQNAYVTSQFLKSLGLQIIMAAPDADVGKLTPILDSYYDLDRYGSDVFVGEVVINEAAKDLFKSDMPDLNPALLEQAVEQMQLV